MYANSHKQDNDPQKEEQPKLPISNSQAELIHTNIMSQIKQIEQFKYSSPYYIPLSDTLNPIKGYTPLIDRQRVSTYGKLNYSTNARIILKSSSAYTPIPIQPNKKVQFCNQVEIFADTSQPIYNAAIINNGQLVIENSLPPNISTYYRPINTRERRVILCEKKPLSQKKYSRPSNEFIRVYLKEFEQSQIIPLEIIDDFNKNSKKLRHYIQNLLQNQMPESLRNDINIVLNALLIRNRNRKKILKDNTNIPDLLELLISQYKKLANADPTHFQTLDNKSSILRGDEVENTNETNFIEDTEFKGTIPVNEYRLENAYFSLKILEAIICMIEDCQTTFKEVIQNLISSSDNIKSEDLQIIPEDDLEACDAIKAQFNHCNDIVRKEELSAEDIYIVKTLIISMNNILGSLKHKYTQSLQTLKNFQNALCSYYSIACEETIKTISDICNNIIENQQCSFESFNEFAEKVKNLLMAVRSSTKREIPNELIDLYKEKISQIHELLIKLAKKAYTDFYTKEPIPAPALPWYNYTSSQPQELNQNIKLIAEKINSIQNLIIKYPLIFDNRSHIVSNPPKDKILREIYNSYYNISKILNTTSKVYMDLLNIRYSNYCNEKDKYENFYKSHILNKDPKRQILNHALNTVNNIYDMYISILDNCPEEKEYWENQKQKLEEQISCKCCI